MDSGNRWRLGRRPALDGLRGIAVLLVIAYHAIGDRFPAGGVVGVTAFFVLSGFLISSLLLEERSTSGRVSLRGFYARRARRLFPALALMLAFAGPVALASGTVTGSDIAAVALYSANWWMLTGHRLGMLIHTWTLSTEEQFYLLWPVALLALARVRRPLVVIGALAAVPLLSATQLSIVVSADALLAGCALAVWMHGRTAPRALPAGVIPACVAILLATSLMPGAPIWPTLLATAVSLGIVYGIATSSAASILDSRLARAVGRRSYGLYLWHLPVLTLSLALGVAAGLEYWQAVVAGLPFLAMIVEGSWRYVEQPILRGRARSGDVEVVDAERARGRRADPRAEADASDGRRVGQRRRLGRPVDAVEAG